ncbi:MAG: type II secretion system minor pseudopilin GspI [Burkholderiales bacterium]|nr:type II secretion system minor pseudopilin GspI [Burkholderiales bacterium]
MARGQRARSHARGERASHSHPRGRPGAPARRAARLHARRPGYSLPRRARGPRIAVGGARRRRGRDHPGARVKGFTLIEILVAVVILAVALAATTRAAGVATDGALETRHRLLATWAAENRVAELRAKHLFPAPATSRFPASQGGLELVIDEVVTATPNPTIRRVDLAAGDARDPGRVLARLTAYVAQ